MLPSDANVIRRVQPEGHVVCHSVCCHNIFERSAWLDDWDCILGVLGFVRCAERSSAAEAQLTAAAANRKACRNSSVVPLHACCSMCRIYCGRKGMTLSRTSCGRISEHVESLQEPCT
jgi:hypothetical protein